MGKEDSNAENEKLWNIEAVKLLYDYIKHLTTLCTGSIIVLITFYEKLSTQPSWKFLLKIALVGFVISIISSTVTLLFFAALAEPHFAGRGPKDGLWGESKLATVTFSLTWGSFFVALISLVTFGCKNL